MPIVRTDAVILKCDNYRETSKIITFYSRSHGKIKGIAKGVRSSKTKWGGALQSMAMLSIMFYYKENRTLHLVSQAEHLTALHNIYDDFDKLQTGYRIIELINRTTAENQENPEIFRLLCDSLEFLENATKNYINVLFNFEFKLLELLGFKINIDDLPANNIDKSVENGYFYETRFNAGDLKTLEAICRGNFNSIMSLNINKSQVFALERFFDNYLRDHFEHAGVSKTKRVFNSN